MAESAINESASRDSAACVPPHPVGPLCVDTVLLACNENSHYLDFWPIVRRAWTQLVGIRAVLVYVGAELPAQLQGDPDVIFFKAISSWPTATQAQCIRLLYPALLAGSAGVTINDMDMVPMQREHYTDDFAHYSADKLVGLRGIDEGWREIYMNGIAAAPATWGEMFSIRTVDDVRDRLREWSELHVADGVHAIKGGVGWCTDQRLFYTHVKEWATTRPERLVFAPWFDPGSPTFARRRLDRIRPAEWDSPDARRQIYNAYGYHIDFHMPPYQENAAVLNEIVDRVAIAYLKNSARIMADDIIQADRFLEAVAGNPACCYIKIDTLVEGRPIAWRGQWHGAVPARVWVSGHGDYPITKEIFERYESNCDIWFATNVEHSHPKLRAIPIGITNDTDESHLHRIYGNVASMAEVASEPRDLAPRLIYANFKPETYRVEREPLMEALSTLPWVDTGTPVDSHDGRREFLRAIRNHKFVVCPRGNGVDTHRLWETLYMGSIPIVRRCPNVAQWDDLPVCFVDNWDSITGPGAPEFLEAEYVRISKMPTSSLKKSRYSYWIAEIMRAAQ